MTSAKIHLYDDLFPTSLSFFSFIPLKYVYNDLFPLFHCHLLGYGDRGAPPKIPGKFFACNFLRWIKLILVLALWNRTD